MSLPFVLDVAIGLIFIYLILSLLASELQELLTTLFQWRAKHLKEAIEVFLAGGTNTPEEEQVRDLVSKLYDDPLLKNINQESKSVVAKGARAITRWLIPGNRRGAFGANQTSGPSYIAPETFSTSLLERLGLATLARKLIEIRLEKFAVRVVGSFRAIEGTLLTDGWEKGRIRLIAEKAKKDLSSDTNFTTLVEEYSDILNDFNTEEATLATCVERMGESLDAYIANYPLPTAPTTQTIVSITPPIITPDALVTTPDAPVMTPDATSLPTDAPGSDPYQDAYQVTVSQPETVVSPEAGASSETVSSMGGEASSSMGGEASRGGEDLAYFSKRLREFKRSLFGDDNKRAVLSGGLQPSLSEIAQLVDESSTTYQEVFHAYESLIAQAEPLEATVNPELEQQLLEAYPEAIEKEIVQAYPETVEEQFLSIAPDVFQGVEKQLVDRRRKIYRAKQASQDTLLKQQRRTLHKALSQLTGEQRQQILSAVLNQFGGEQRDVMLSKSLEQLSNEQRYAVIGIVFAKPELKLTNADRSVYDNYQTYKTIQQVLQKLPSSVKESFAILARRAQTKVQRTSHDLNQFREEISTWFDNSMSRASGVYKRNAKGVALLIGLVLASMTNSDTFYIVTRLSSDENLRKVITDRATEIRPNANASAAASSLDLTAVKQQTDAALKDLSLPIGWKRENLARQFDCPLPDQVALDQAKPIPVKPPAICEVFYVKPESLSPASVTQLLPSVTNLLLAKPLDLLKLLGGWLVSGIAIAMGAPFWFDLLGKVMNVRNSGSKPVVTEGKGK